MKILDAKLEALQYRYPYAISLCDVFKRYLCAILVQFPCVMFLCNTFCAMPWYNTLIQYPCASPLCAGICRGLVLWSFMPALSNGLLLGHMQWPYAMII